MFWGSEDSIHRYEKNHHHNTLYPPPYPTLQYQYNHIRANKDLVVKEVLLDPRKHLLVGEGTLHVASAILVVPVVSTGCKRCVEVLLALNGGGRARRSWVLECVGHWKTGRLRSGNWGLDIDFMKIKTLVKGHILSLAFSKGEK